MRRISGMVFVGLALSVPVAAAKGDMSVEAFLAKADTLKAKGVGALFSSDFKILEGEVNGAGTAYRQRIEADKKASRVPHSCPPQKAKLKSDQLLAHFRSYPVADRPKISVKTAFSDMMKKRYPCP